MLFGLFHFEEKTYIKKLNLSNDVSQMVDDMFKKQRKNFFFDQNEEIRIEDFYPGTTESNEVISKIEFDDPEGLYKTIAAPGELPVCNPEQDLENLTAIFTQNPDNNKEILFQLTESRRVLLPKSGWLVFKSIAEKIKDIASPCSPGTFVEMDEIGLRLADKITSVYDGKYLYFKSFFQAGRIFDLGEYLEEATDETVKEFLSLNCIYDNGNHQEIIKKLSHAQRRRVAKAMALGFVKSLSAAEIVQRARKAKKNIHVELEHGKIKIPESANERGILLQFLGNGIMSSYLDDENDYEVSSTRPMK